MATLRFPHLREERKVGTEEMDSSQLFPLRAEAVVPVFSNQSNTVAVLGNAHHCYFIEHNEFKLCNIYKHVYVYIILGENKIFIYLWVNPATSLRCKHTNTARPGFLDVR